MQNAIIGFVMLVCPFVHSSAWKNSAPIDRIFLNSVLVFFENLLRKFNFK
jgi:hypothetical protein